jgi:DeoR family transcriptional regulator, aga operon transcriptional repressor
LLLLHGDAAENHGFSECAFDAIQDSASEWIVGHIDIDSQVSGLRSTEVATKDEINRREQWILEHLLQAGEMTTQALCAEFDISEATARRDLEDMEKRGRLRRTHGGAVSLEPLLYEPFRHVSSFRDQIEKQVEEKRRIAQAAAELINDGDTIALTPGTTTTHITRLIGSGKSITVVTNTVNVAMELSNRPDITVFVTGGFLKASWFSLVGEEANNSMRRLFVDKAFIGANALHPEHGAMAYYPDEAAFNQIMIEHAKEKIAVVDSSKLGLVATHIFCPVTKIHKLITDTGASARTIEAFRAHGIEVRCV